jgi:cytochrome c-type biogenesis protein CcmH/NrfG
MRFFWVPPVLGLIALALAAALVGCTGAQTRNEATPIPAAATVGEDSLIELQERADHAYAEGRLLDAEQLYRRLLRAHPRSTHALLRLGNTQLRNSELDAAALSFRECIKYSPEDARCWNNLALTYVKMSADTLEQSTQFVKDPTQAAELEAFRRRVVGSTAAEVTEGR